MNHIETPEDTFDPSQVKVVIFDFGNVLINIEQKRTFDALTQLLGYEAAPSLAPESVAKAMLDFEKGDLTVENFLWKFQLVSQKEMPHGRPLIDAWNEMLIGMHQGRFDMLERLRKQYTVCLLSNTNELHLDWIYRYFKKEFQLTDFDNRYFDKTYYSHKVRMRKPDNNIYQFVQDDLKASPREILFFDDVIENLDAPKSLGWQTYHHDPKNEITEIVENKLRLFS